jgi:biopolymer transport protein ExbD
MLSSSFITQPGIRINLPKVVTSEVVKYGNIEITLTNENTIYLDGKVINIGELKTLFKQAANRGQAILIKADKRASLGRVGEIWDLARGMGISQLNIATNQE